MQLASHLRVVLAPNPGPMTGPGTKQYLLGDEAPLLIDVAAYDEENARRLGAALAATGGRLVTEGRGRSRSAPGEKGPLSVLSSASAESSPALAQAARLRRTTHPAVPEMSADTQAAASW